MAESGCQTDRLQVVVVGGGARSANMANAVAQTNYGTPTVGTSSVYVLRYGDPYAANGVDENGRAAIEWGVYGVPETFVVGRDAHIAFKLIGPITPENLDAVLKPEIEKAIAAGG